MKLSLLAMMVLTACAASHSRPNRPWRMELVTSGGFAGRGNGNYTIDSAGKIGVVSTSGRTCAFDAAPEDVTRFEDLLRAAKPGTWNESYVPENSCCDRFEYSLTIEEAGVKRTVRWIDDPLPMPKDLEAISNAMIGGADSLRVRFSERCR